MKRPFFSIIIPALNEQKTISLCLDSISRQSFQDYETIIVFSGADRTGKIARLFGARVIRAPVIGPGACRNLGAKKAKGEVLVFLDADTRIPADYLSKLADFFKNPEISSATCCFGFHDGNFIDRVAAGFSDLAHHALRLSGLHHYHPGFCCAVRSKDFWGMGGFDASLVHGEDTDLSIKLARRGAAGHIRGLRVLTSARRLHEQGYLRMALFYLVNIFSVALRGRAALGYSYGH